MNPGSGSQRGLREGWSNLGWLPGGGGLLSCFLRRGAGEKASSQASKVDYPECSPSSQILGSTNWKEGEKFRCLVFTTPPLSPLMEGCPQTSGHSWQGSCEVPRTITKPITAMYPLPFSQALPGPPTSFALGPALPASLLSCLPDM